MQWTELNQISVTGRFQLQVIESRKYIGFRSTATFKPNSFKHLTIHFKITNKERLNSFMQVDIATVGTVY